LLKEAVFFVGLQIPAAQLDRSVRENTAEIARLTGTKLDLVGVNGAYPMALSGPDKELFVLNLVTVGTTGEEYYDFAFKIAPNFESRQDANGDGIYDVTVTVTDRLVQQGSDSTRFLLTVADVNEISSFTKGADLTDVPAAVSPRIIPGWASAISDGDPAVTQALTFTFRAISGGDRLSVPPAIDPATGNLSFTPSGIAGTARYAVTLTDDASINGTSALTTAEQTFDLTFIAVPPTLTSVSPATGSTAGGTVVTLTGTGFTGASSVTFGGTAATAFTVDSATQITATTPARALGAVSVVVTTTPGGTNAANTLFTYIAAPTLTNISPATGSPAGGTSVTLTGTGFTGATGVTIGGAAATSVSVVNATTITCTTPAGSAGTASVLVITPGGTNAANTLFTYIAAPTLTNVSPATGSRAGGTSVTLTGTNFTGATVVTFDGEPATNIIVVNATTITCTTPAGQIGTASVLVTTPSGTVSSSTLFSYFLPPSFASISPPGGVLAGGTPVTIKGGGFVAPMTVTFGGVAATEVTVVNSTTLTATTPAHAGGAVDVVVSNANASATGTGAFYYFPIPTVTGVAPATGLIAGGRTVTITGSGFNEGAGVRFDGVEAQGVIFVNDTTLTAVTPAHAAGVVDVEVFSFFGSGTGTGLFTYQIPPSVVSGVSPNLGALTGGKTVTITGTGFTGATAVSFGGAAATGLTDITDTSLKVTIPPHAAGVVDVVVTTPAVSITGKDAFAYVSPGILGVSPPLGVPTGGTVVTITGSGFTGATGVSFGGTAATGLTVVNDTSITVTTPAHASEAVDVVVTNSLGSTTGAKMFTYVPGPEWRKRIEGVFTSVASSEDGLKLAACAGTGFIWTSEDAGATWTQRTTSGSRSWRDIASSADGTRLAACAKDAGIFTSEDSGATWFARPLANIKPERLASSADGLRLAACQEGGGIATSADGGVTWTLQVSVGAADWKDIASSADGLKLAAVIKDGHVWTSVDGGSSWIESTGLPTRKWQCIASSADGLRLFAGSSKSGFFGDPSTWASGDGGASWGSAIEIANIVYGLSSIAASADGTRLMAYDRYTLTRSNDHGIRWAPDDAAPSYGLACASSADGNRLAVAVATASPNLWTFGPRIDAPQVASVSPKYGLPAGGTPVTIKGRYFTAPLTVMFGGVVASNVTVVDANTLTVTAPPHAVGEVLIEVTTLQGTAIGRYGYGDSTIRVEDDTGLLVPSSNATPIEFGTLAGGTSRARSFTLYNSGTLALTNLTSFFTPGTDRGNFSLTTPPQVPVQPGGSTSFTVTFAPVQDGHRVERLNFEDNEGKILFNCQVGGTVVLTPRVTLTDAAGQLLLGGSTVDFGKQGAGFTKKRTLILSNTGTTPITGLSVSSDNQYFYSLTTLPSTLEPGASVEWVVGFTAPALQPGVNLHSSRFTITTAASSQELLVQGESVASNPADIGVQLDAPPTELVSKAVPPLSFGNVQQGAQSVKSFTIRNDGTQPLTGLTVTKTGTGSADFLVEALDTTELGAEDRTSFTVTFRPTASGARPAVLKIASNDGDEKSFEINLTGTGVVPEIGIALGTTALVDGTGTVSFGTTPVPVFTTTTQTLTLSNTGSAPLQLGAVFLDGAHAGDFSVTSPPATLAIGATAQITVSFKPSAAGARTAALHLLSNDANESSYDLKLSGTGLASNLSLQYPAKTELINQTSQITFGPVKAPAVSSRVITLKNVGNSPLTGITATLGGPVATRFSIGTTPAIPTTLAPNASVTFTVTYNPAGSTALIDRATLTLATNDPNEASFTVNLTGVIASSATPPSLPFVQPPVNLVKTAGTEVELYASFLPVDNDASYTYAATVGTAKLSGNTTAVRDPDTQALTLLEHRVPIPSLALIHGGTYTLTGSNSAKQIVHTGSAILTVVDGTAKRVNAASTSTATFTVSAATAKGTTLTYQWTKDGFGDLTGQTTNTLKLTALTSADEGTYRCRVTGPGGSSLGGPNVLTVFDDSPVIVTNSVVGTTPTLKLPDGIVSGPVNFRIPLDPTRGEASNFISTNLPAGLKLNALTGDITGKPTAANTYNFTVTAKNAKGGSPVPATLLVSPLPTGSVRSYVGLLTRKKVNGNLGGRMTVSIAATGVWTGKLVLGDKTYNFPVGSINASLGVTDLVSRVVIARPPLNPINVDFTIDTLTKRLKDGSVTSGTDTCAMIGWGNVWGSAVPDQATAYAGYYTFHTRNSLLQKRPSPTSEGIGSFTVPADGKEFVVAGSLPDGDAFTSSTFLGPQGEVSIHALLPAKGTLTGHQEIGLGATNAQNSFVNSLPMDLSWSRPASTLATATTYKAGFDAKNVGLIGARYTFIVPPSSIQQPAIVLGKAAGPNNANLMFTDANISTVADGPLRLIPSKVKFTTPLIGPTLRTMTLDPVTGKFTGNFTLTDTHPFLSGAPLIVRKVTFQGIIVQLPDQLFGSGGGRGFFLLQQLPQNVIPAPTVLPVLSGSVQLY